VLLLALTVSSSNAHPELVEAEARAASIVSACRDLGDCDPDTLAKAFLVQATAASVLRGQVDPVAAANLRELDPALAERWRQLLADGAEAEPWVRQVATRSNPSVTPASDPRGPFAPSRSTLRIAGAGGFDLGGARGQLEAELRAKIAGPVSVFARLDAGIGSRPLSPSLKEELGTEMSSLAQQNGEATAALALASTPSPTSDLLFFLGPTFTSSAGTFSSFTGFAADGLALSPASVALGATIGAIGTIGLPGSERVSLRLDVAATSLAGTYLNRYLDGRRGDLRFAEAGPPPRWSRRSLRVGLDLAARLTRRLAALAGVEARLEHTTSGGGALPFESATRWRGPVFRLGTSLAL